MYTVRPISRLQVRVVKNMLVDVNKFHIFCSTNGLLRYSYCKSTNIYTVEGVFVLSFT